MGAAPGWIWTVLAACAGALALYLGQALTGVILILSALAACPPAVAALERQTGARLGGGLRLALVLVFAGLAALSIAQNPASWKKLLPAPAPVQARLLLQEQGDFGNKTTKLFTPQGGDWDLQWSFDCATLGDSGNFSVKVMHQGGVLSDAAVEEIRDHDFGARNYHRGGTFYLQIVSECRWDIRVTG